MAKIEYFEDRYGPRIALRFPYNREAKEELQSQIRFPALKWDKGRKAWTIDTNQDTIEKSVAILDKYGYDFHQLLQSKSQGITKQKESTTPTNGLLIDAFLIGSNPFSEAAFYWINPPDDYGAKWRYIQQIKRKHPDILMAMGRGGILVVETELPTESVDNKIIRPHPNPRNKEWLIESLIKESIKKIAHLEGYNERNGEYCSNEPIAQCGEYELYHAYHVRVHTLPNEKRLVHVYHNTIRASKKTLLDMLTDGDEIEYGSRFKHSYDGNSCYYRGMSSRTISDENPAMSGQSLIEWARREASNNPRIRKHLKRIESEPEMPAVEVDYNHFSDKSKKTYSFIPLLLQETLENDRLPENVINEFMKHSHIDIHRRFQLVQRFRKGFKEHPITHEISQYPTTLEQAGFQHQAFSGKLLEFGNGHFSSWSARDIAISIRNHGFVKGLEKPISLGVIPIKSQSPTLDNFMMKVCRFLKSANSEIHWQWLEPWDPNERISPVRLEENLKGVECDCILVQIPYFNEEIWKRWKRGCAQANMPNQLVTTSSIQDDYVPLNIALGILCKLGGSSFRLTGLKSGIDAWIGLDVGRRGKINVGASSVAFDSDGTAIGWSDVTRESGERIADDSLRNLLENIVDNVNLQREKMSRIKAKRIAILRDGRFYEQLDLFKEVGDELGVEFILAEVRKSGAFRLADRHAEQYSATNPGTAFWQGRDGYLQCTQQRWGTNVGSPVLVHVLVQHGMVEMEDFLHDLFWLSKLHVGATMQPGIPVPIHFADRIAKFAGMGVLRESGFTTKLDFI